MHISEDIVTDRDHDHHFHLNVNGHTLVKKPYGAARLTGFHPTHTHIQHGAYKELMLNWTSRDHRKARQHIEIQCQKGEELVKTWADKLRWRLPALKYYVQPLNISWLVAFLFTVGSVVWIVNGFFVFLPYVNERNKTYPDAIAWTAFAGGTIFEIGAIFGVLEALHSQGENVEFDYKPVKKRRIHRMKLRINWRDLGTQAAFVQVLAATIFWISTIAGCVPAVVEDPLSGLAIGLFWTEQVVGGAGFMISSLLIMFETQKKWWMVINIRCLGWHVGFWNLVGAVGFLLCGALGYSSGVYHGTAYQSACSTFWGSWAFLIGSVLQLWESIDRNRKKMVIVEPTL